MKTIAIISLIILSNISMAQDLNAIQSAMDKLGILEGEWQGSGWIQQEGVKLEFTQKEKVERKLNGTTLLIEGKGFDNDSLVFHATAMASYNLETKKYRFNSFLADGKYTEAEGWFDESGIFHWQFGVPGGTVRYSITITKENWKEKGSFNPQNTEQWYPFMQMALTKLK